MEHGEHFLSEIWSGNPSRLSSRSSRYPAHQQIGDLQQHLGFSGPSMIVSNACASGANAIGHAADLLRQASRISFWQVDMRRFANWFFVVLIPYKPWIRMFAARSTSAAAASCLARALHFSLWKPKLMPSIGARGVQSRLPAMDIPPDTHHITQPDPTGAPLETAMRRALDQAGVQASEIGYLNAHGTGTVFNDGAEAAAFQRGSPGCTGRMRLGSSTKAATGHTLGAAGSLEARSSPWSACSGPATFLPQIDTDDPIPELGRLLGEAGRQTLSTGGPQC
jgi:3-oxoacyl-[acyl-carrier-protein] synthase II